MNQKEQLQILESFVEPAVFERLSQPHTKENHGCPFAWMQSYSGKSARQNIQYFENAIKTCKLDFPVRVWFNTWSDSIVISFVPLEAVREPHVLEWFLTFYEVPVEAAKNRLDKWPTYPYDGRSPDTVRAELWASGETPAGIERKSKQHLEALGIPWIKKF